MNGILIIDKPEKFTSHDVVARLRRILNMKSIGHTGTLDPFATGVMVMLIGKATRLAQFLDKDKKEYEAIVRLGYSTDTGDRTGSPKSEVQSSKSKVSEREIEDVLAQFRGEIEQTPPMYSAKKVAGKKLYELARKGIEIERKPVNVTIYELQMTSCEPPKENIELRLWTLDFGLKIECSAGTYIRTLAEDIGEKLRTGAHLTELRRSKAGKFGIEKSVTLENLEKLVSENTIDDVLVPMNEAISHLPEIKLSAVDAAKIKNGVKLKLNTKPSDGFCRLTDADENLIAVGSGDSETKIVKPKLVLV